MKKILIAVVVVILLGIAGAFYWMYHSAAPEMTPPEDTMTPPTTATTTTEGPTAVIGKSAGGRDITAYNFGTGTTTILFVGGIHGGYEWNTSLVAYQLVDYLNAHPDAVPQNERVTVIPVVNPDGLNKVVTVGADGRFTKADVATPESATVPGRFNGNTVDLNRNFDCDWQAEGTWQSKTVSGGTSAFSEPESQAIKGYLESHNPAAVIVWYSQAGGVFASSCHNGVLPETATLTQTFADASGYKAYQTFDFYEVTGDMVNWLAKQKIPAISVLLTNHTDTEWDKNLAGIQAVLEHYAE